MNLLLIAIVVVGVCAAYAILEIGGEAILHKLGILETKLSRRQRRLAFVVISLFGASAVIWIIATHDYHGLFK